MEHKSQQNMFPSFFQSPRPPSYPNLGQSRKDQNYWFPKWKTILQPTRQRQPPTTGKEALRSAIKSKLTMAGRVIEMKPIKTAESSKEEMEAKERRKQETMEKHERWFEKRKKRNEKLIAESPKEKKREARRRKRIETVRETAEERITRREARMSTEVNRHAQANKIWVKSCLYQPEL